MKKDKQRKYYEKTERSAPEKNSDLERENGRLEWDGDKKKKGHCKEAWRQGMQDRWQGNST